MMMHQLYTCDFEHLIPCTTKGKRELEIKCEKITAKLGGWKNAIQWYVATTGKVKAYTVYDCGKLIHSSYVIWGRTKFKFLKKHDIEIGPCWTHPDYRGIGIYPAVLSHVIQKEMAGGGGLLT